MGLQRTDEFCQDAVRIALNSGLTRKQVVDGLVDAEQMDHSASRHGCCVLREFKPRPRE